MRIRRFVLPVFAVATAEKIMLRILKGRRMRSAEHVIRFVVVTS